MKTFVIICMTYFWGKCYWKLDNNESKKLWLIRMAMISIIVCFDLIRTSICLLSFSLFYQSSYFWWIFFSVCFNFITHKIISIFIIITLKIHILKWHTIEKLPPTFYFSRKKSHSCLLFFLSLMTSNTSFKLVLISRLLEIC